MTSRTRKFTGTMILLAFLAIYALIVAAVAYPILAGAGKLTELAFYLIAGLAWTIPAAALIWWMQKPDS